MSERRWLLASSTLLTVAATLWLFIDATIGWPLAFAAGLWWGWTLAETR